MNSWIELLTASQNAAKADSKNPNAAVQFLVNKKTDLIKNLSSHTGRNTILYFSAFLHKVSNETNINDKDLNAFMANVHKMDKGKGLDLILHTPGGDLSATEQIFIP